MFCLRSGLFTVLACSVAMSASADPISLDTVGGGGHFGTVNENFDVVEDEINDHASALELLEHVPTSIATMATQLSDLDDKMGTLATTLDDQGDELIDLDDRLADLELGPEVYHGARRSEGFRELSDPSKNDVSREINLPPGRYMITAKAKVSLPNRTDGLTTWRSTGGCTLAYNNGAGWDQMVESSPTWVSTTLHITLHAVVEVRDDLPVYLRCDSYSPEAPAKLQETGPISAVRLGRVLSLD